jgi:hypothetical protein
MLVSAYVSKGDERLAHCCLCAHGLRPAGLERGYALVDDRNKTVTTTLTVLVASNRQWTGARPCPQNFYW